MWHDGLNKRLQKTSRPKKARAMHVFAVRVSNPVAMGLLAVATVTLAAGCQTASGPDRRSAPEAPPNEHVRVEGRVVTDIGTPVAGAEILVVPRETGGGLGPVYYPESVKTGHDGRFVTMVTRYNPPAVPVPDTVTAIVRVTMSGIRDSTVAVLHFATLDQTPMVEEADIVLP